MTLRAFSYGGGVQSTAALVLAAEGVLDFPLFLFANVGEDSEHPDTLAFVADVAMPYAEAHGIELVEVRREWRDGRRWTLREAIDRMPRSVVIPARMDNGAPGTRTCTYDFKIKVIEKALRERGATREDPAVVGLGISLDEYQRMRSPSDPHFPFQTREYPLIDPLRLTRQDCLNVISNAGLPRPGRSACYFCPFHSGEEWRRLARTRPDLFARAEEVERVIHERGRALGRGDFYLSDARMPLGEAFDGNQLSLLDDDEEGGSCESGYCMT